MDDELKPSLDGLEQRILLMEKRFDDVKWYIGGASFVFSALLLVLGWNFSGDRSALREELSSMRADIKDRLTIATGSMEKLEEQLKEQFSQSAAPQMVLLGWDGRPLEGQHIATQVKIVDDRAAELSFKFGLRNTGNGISGPIWIKFYMQKDLPTFDASADDPTYPTEARSSPSDLHPGILPGKFSLLYTSTFRLPPPAAGEHHVLARAFYGNGSTSDAAFFLEVK